MPAISNTSRVRDQRLQFPVAEIIAVLRRLDGAVEAEVPNVPDDVVQLRASLSEEYPALRERDCANRSTLPVPARACASNRCACASNAAQKLRPWHLAQMWGWAAIQSKGLALLLNGTRAQSMMAFMSTRSCASSMPVVEAQPGRCGAQLRYGTP